jgi:ATP-dependent HslUV protease, peptidase subunit HslV
MKGTTVLAIKTETGLVIGGDGQVTYGNMVLKAGANKVRRLAGGRVLAGFAGSTADAFALFERFEGKLKDANYNLTRAAVELAKDWRGDKVLRQLEAVIVVGDKETLLMLTGNGDVVEPEDGVTAIGSGGPYALAAAKALMKHSTLPTEEIVTEALHIAASICIYTNDNLHVERLDKND